MLLHILKKDLKRKRTMNAVLLVFIILATTFMASSVSNMITIMGAVDNFFEISNIPDEIVIVLGEEENVNHFLDASDYVTEYGVMDVCTVASDRIKIVECSQAPGREKYEKGNTLSVSAVPTDFIKVFDEEENPLSLKPGELAIPKQEAENNGLLAGDVLKITCGDNSKEFIIKTITKDAAFGSPMIGYKRMIINEEDFQDAG